MHLLARLPQKKDLCKICLYVYYAGLVLVSLVPIYLIYSN